MRTRHLWLVVVALVAVSVSLEIAVHGVDMAWHRVRTACFRTLVSPFVLLPIIVMAAVFGALGLWLADRKNRSPFEGFALGFFLGPLGILIDVLLPELGACSEIGLRGKAER